MAPFADAVNFHKGWRQYTVVVLALRTRNDRYESSDAEVIAKALEQPEIFRVIFERHHRAVWRFLARRYGRGVADDLAAATFELAFAKRRNFDPSRGNALPWLLGIAVNLARRHRRREEAELKNQALQANGFAMPPESLRGQMADSLSRLHPRDRDALLLYAIADLSYEEIAEALQIPTGTVRSRLNRARRLIKEALEE